MERRIALLLFAQKLADVIRYIVILTMLLYMLAFLWDISLVWAAIGFLPAVFVAVNAAGFLTLPLYALVGYFFGKSIEDSF